MGGACIWSESENLVSKASPTGKLVTLRLFDIQFTVEEQLTPHICLNIGARDEVLDTGREGALLVSTGLEK